MKKIRTQEEAMQEMKHKVDPRGKQKPDKDISQSTVAKTGHGKEIKIRRNQVNDKFPEVICIGMNYKDHCEEQNAPIPKEPVVFNKFPSCIVGPTASLPYPKCTKELDWEVELAVVIGRRAANLRGAKP